MTVYVILWFCFGLDNKKDVRIYNKEPLLKREASFVLDDKEYESDESMSYIILCIGAVQYWHLEGNYSEVLILFWNDSDSCHLMQLRRNVCSNTLETYGLCMFWCNYLSKTNHFWVLQYKFPLVTYFFGMWCLHPFTTDINTKNKINTKNTLKCPSIENYCIYSTFLISIWI